MCEVAACACLCVCVWWGMVDGMLANSNLPKWQNNNNIHFHGHCALRCGSTVCVFSSSFKPYLSISVQNLIASTQSPHKYVPFCVVFINIWLWFFFFFVLLVIPSVCWNRLNVTGNVCEMRNNQWCAPFVFCSSNFDSFKFVQVHFSIITSNSSGHENVTRNSTLFVPP